MAQAGPFHLTKPLQVGPVPGCPGDGQRTLLEGSARTGGTKVLGLWDLMSQAWVHSGLPPRGGGPGPARPSSRARRSPRWLWGQKAVAVRH